MWQGAASMWTARAVVRPPESLGPDAEPVDPLEQPSFHRRVERVGMGGSQGLPEEGLLREERRSLEIPADPDADDEGRAGGRAGPVDGLHDEILDGVPPRGRREHPDRAPVLGPSAFGHEGDLERVPRDDVPVDEGGGVGPGVGPAQGIRDDGLPQVAFAVSGDHAVLDGPAQAVRRPFAFEPDAFADLDEEDGQAGVLAEAQPLGGGDGGVLPELAEDLFPRLRFLGGGHRLEAGGDVGGQDEIGFLDQTSDPVPDIVESNAFHAVYRMVPIEGRL